MYNLPVDYNKIHWSERKLVREQYIREQDGNCMYCENPLDKDPPQLILETPINLNLFPVNMLKYPVHLQHNHSTGMTEGAVHARCNCILWQYEGR